LNRDSGTLRGKRIVVGRAPVGARRAVHGGAALLRCGTTPYLKPSISACSTPVNREAGVHRFHAQAAGHSQRDSQNLDSLERACATLKRLSELSRQPLNRAWRVMGK